MSAHRVIFLNYHAAETGSLGDTSLRQDYVLACRFLHCSILDRTTTLATGFNYAILDPLPSAGNGTSFGELCEIRGSELVDEAIHTDREIRVFWSGGIDSTTALVAILKAAADRGYCHRVRVLLTLESVHEYPRFFLHYLHGRVGIEALGQPFSAHLLPDVINVTGEHGDQLFGSHLLRSYVQRGVADADYRDILPFVLLERLRSVRAARRVQRFLQPVIDAAPIRVHTLFDYLWWLNFTLKWQEVSLRLFTSDGLDAASRFQSTHHFFRDERFQAWAMSVDSRDRCPAAWERYKDIAKAYIREYTGDDDYFRDKEKEDSLRNIMPRSTTGEPTAIYMREDFQPVVRVVSSTVSA